MQDVAESGIAMMGGLQARSVRLLKGSVSKGEGNLGHFGEVGLALWTTEVFEVTYTSPLWTPSLLDSITREFGCMSRDVPPGV